MADGMLSCYATVLSLKITVFISVKSRERKRNRSSLVHSTCACGSQAWARLDTVQELAGAPVCLWQAPKYLSIFSYLPWCILAGTSWKYSQALSASFLMWNVGIVNDISSQPEDVFIWKTELQSRRKKDLQPDGSLLKWLPYLGLGLILVARAQILEPSSCVLRYISRSNYLLIINN